MAKSDGKQGRSPQEWINFLKSKGAPKKLIDQIRAIEESGKKYNRSESYVLRSIQDKIPSKYLEKPTGVHGPGKSGPKSEPSKKKSSIELSPEEFFEVEHTLQKIAKENGISNVKQVEVSVTANEAIVRFKSAVEFQEDISIESPTSFAPKPNFKAELEQMDTAFESFLQKLIEQKTKQKMNLESVDPEEIKKLDDALQAIIPTYTNLVDIVTQQED